MIALSLATGLFGAAFVCAVVAVLFALIVTDEGDDW